MSHFWYTFRRKEPHTMCNWTTFALRHTQISLSGILRHFRLPSRHLLLNMHDTNMEFLQLNGPLLDIFLFFSKTKIFHSHPCNTHTLVGWTDQWSLNEIPIWTKMYANTLKHHVITSNSHLSSIQVKFICAGLQTMASIMQSATEQTWIVTILKWSWGNHCNTFSKPHSENNWSTSCFVVWLWLWIKAKVIHTVIQFSGICYYTKFKRNQQVKLNIQLKASAKVFWFGVFFCFVWFLFSVSFKMTLAGFCPLNDDWTWSK